MSFYVAHCTRVVYMKWGLSLNSAVVYGNWVSKPFTLGVFFFDVV